MSDSDNDIIFENISSNCEDSVTSRTKQIIPEKSKPRYDRMYSTFKQWLKSKHTNKINERTVLAFFTEKSQVLHSSSLWTNYSMLKSTLQLHENIDISKFEKLIVFLKKRHSGYTPKKSKALQMEHIVRFLKEAPNQYYLMMKVATIMGISGACRTCELLAMRVDDIEDKGTVLIGKVFDSKRNMPRTFVVSNEQDLDLLKLYRDYVALRPSAIETRRLFVRYCEGKCVRQVVGKHILSKIPQRIAEFLELPDAVQYTGHCFRRTSITMLSRNRKDLISSKLHIGWQSTYPGEGESTSAFRPQNEASSSSEFVKSEFVDMSEINEDDMEDEGEFVPLLKSELGTLDSDESVCQTLNESRETSKPANYESILKENESLKQEVYRLKQELLLSRQRETKLEQIVQTVRELVYQDIDKVVTIKEENQL